MSGHTPDQDFVLALVAREFGMPKEVRMEKGTLIIDLTDLYERQAANAIR